MIVYRRAGLDPDSIKLLSKLGGDFPLDSLLLDIENKKLTLLNVLYDEKPYGLLVVRGEITRRGQHVLVVLHAIAEDKLNVHFSSILAESLQAFAKSDGFELIRQHADKKSLARMLERYYGQPFEYVYQIGVDQCQAVQRVHPAAVSQLAHKQQTAA